jgi:hypothetical protein
MIANEIATATAIGLNVTPNQLRMNAFIALPARL